MATVRITGANIMAAPTKDAVRFKEGRGNFRDESGRPYVVHCPKCDRENWGPAVASGQCAWCGWDARAQANASERMIESAS